MGQLRMIDEDELPAIARAKFCEKEYYDLQKKLSELRDIMYPNIDIWIDVGSELTVNEVFIERAIKDGKKYNYRWKKRFLK